MVGTQRLCKVVVVRQSSAYQHISVFQQCCRIEEVASHGIAFTAYVEPLASFQSLHHLFSVMMVGEVVIVFSSVIVYHLAVDIDEGDTQVSYVMFLHIFIYHFPIYRPVAIAACLYHICQAVVIVLQVKVEHVYLKLFFAVLLKHDKQYGKDQKE